MINTVDLPPAQGLYDPAFEHDACGIGFVADIAGRRSHRLIEQGLEILINLQHRGACGSDPNTGDGAGILIQMPDRFLQKVARSRGIVLPAEGNYGSGLVFLPKAAPAREAIRAIVARVVREQGQTLLGWRIVPVVDGGLGPAAAAARPDIWQVFISASEEVAGRRASDPLAFERQLYVIRRRIEHEVERLSMPERKAFYIPSLSSRTFIYKGMLTAGQLKTAFPDLGDPDLETALALVHQRFSTNTFPSWPLAHPYRLIAHNGEINTVRGNINWMKAREALLESPLLGDDLRRLLPVITDGGSDSATFDNVLELLVMAGRPLPHALLMMVPEPWAGDRAMSPELRAFYEYHASLMEPWDGPAAIAFTDGRVIGAMLDRNGLRPARYCVTRSGLVVLASESGVIDLPPGEIARKGRVQPGRMFLVDTVQGCIVPDEAIKRELAAAHPYRDWMARHVVDIDDLPLPAAPMPLERDALLARQQVFGYTQEDLDVLLTPMASSGEEPIGSMGSDSALPILSTRPRLLFDYFTQGFAQVTNPPLDAIREELVTTMASTIGPEGNLLRTGEPAWRQIRIAYPVVDNAQLARLRALDRPDLRAVTLQCLFDARSGGEGLAHALEELSRQSSDAVSKGFSILILSDRGVDRDRAPIPSLLAAAAVHHHLVRTGLRGRCGLVVETADAREVHHCAVLLGYGAGAVNPYLAFETLDGMIRGRQLTGIAYDEAVRRYVGALNKGILKVMSKMGISALQSYRGAQVFEAVGLDKTLVDRHFTGTPSRIGGIDLDGIAREALERHSRAYRRPPRSVADLESGGEYRWRRDGEHHLFSPESVFKLQHATRTGQYRIFKEYTRLVDDQTRRAATLRGLLALRPARPPVPIEEVEPSEAIVKRFVTGAMSFGSISEEAHSTIAIAMNRLGAKSNSGEGGEDPARNRPDANGDSRRSAIRQIASARFGVTSEYLVNADELQIKMAQGAKPGEGGQLPGPKVYPWIARVRHSTPGVGLISPPPHHDIYSIEDLAQLIYDLRCANPNARISVKLVAAAGVGTVAAGVAKAHADAVLISGHDGGTGAAPLTGIKHAGVPWELGLAETQQVLRLNGLRGRVRVQADGQLKTGRDVVVAALLGAEEFGFATAPLVVSGCVMMRVCHLNTCPVGIATQDPVLRRRFTGAPEFVVNFFRFLAEEVREHMAALGFLTMEEMIGRVECLEPHLAFDHWKARGVDLSGILESPSVPDSSPRRNVERQNRGVEKALDHHLLEQCGDAIAQRRAVRLRVRVSSVHRAVGTMLGSGITREWGSEGLPEDTIRIDCSGSAGQSFGAFIPRGLTLTLEGDSNDYVGKGLSGGRIVVLPPQAAAFAGGENIIIGNVALYGATSGEAYIGGIAGERFAVRNSGAVAVVEGVGDHGCEYMTGGCVLVLGRTGRNFAAGMTGGIAVVFDPAGEFDRHCNPGSVDLERIESEDSDVLHALVTRHLEYTGSDVAAALLARWRRALEQFVKVVPREYKRAVAGGRTVALSRVAAPVILSFPSARAEREVLHG